MDIYVTPKIGELTPLCLIMNKYGSDKSTLLTEGRNWHNYTLYYSALFEHSKDKIHRVFELGLGTNNVNISSNMGAHGKPGASLRGWAEYFPKANIFGADIDKDILFTENRIQTFFCDQTNKDVIQEMWNNHLLTESFDVIIDDGLHTFEANKTFFEHSIHKLSDNGVYIIEDILNEDLHKFLSIIPQWCIQFNLNYTVVKLPHFRNFYDNTLIVFQKK